MWYCQYNWFRNEMTCSINEKVRNGWKTVGKEMSCETRTHMDFREIIYQLEWTGWWNSWVPWILSQWNLAVGTLVFSKNFINVTQWAETGRLTLLIFWFVASIQHWETFLMLQHNLKLLYWHQENGGLWHKYLCTKVHPFFYFRKFLTVNRLDTCRMHWKLNTAGYLK